MEVQYVNNSFPYNNSAGSYANFFEGLAYEHVNFIFADAIYSQESMYHPNIQASPYKFGLSDPNSYYDYNNTMLNGHSSSIHDYSRDFENQQTINSQHTAPQWNGNNASADTNNNNNIDCVFPAPRVHFNTNNNQVIWHDDVDPDNMTYEELLALGETVGSQSRGLTPDLISLLPVRKFKTRLFFYFFRKKSKTERCVICQMEYKRGNRQMILPCKHTYHVDCGTKWLSINKACPICYTEVSINNNDDNNKSKH